MKKILLTCLVCFTAFISTGCVKLGYNIDIDKNDKISVSETKGAVFEGFKSTIFQDALLSELDNTIANYTRKGYKVKHSAEGDYGSITLTKDNLVFGEAVKSLPKGFLEKSTFESDAGLIKRQYKIHLFYNLQDAVDNTISSYAEFRPNSAVLEKIKDSIREPIVDVQTIEVPETGRTLVTKRYADGNAKVEVWDGGSYNEIANNFLYPEAVLTIKIPVKATAHNADNVVNDKEYQWYLAKEEQPVEIILEYEFNEFGKLAAVISLILILGAVFFLVKKVNSSDVVKGL